MSQPHDPPLKDLVEAVPVDWVALVGEPVANEKLDMVELASWAMVASVVLNLDETITRNWAHVAHVRDDRTTR